PNTSLESTSSMKNAATLSSRPTSPRPNGRARNPTKLAQNARIGAIRNRSVSDPVGAVSSFMNSLMPSARDCNSPNGPVRVGPSRSWMRPETFRSAQMAKYAETLMNPNSRAAAVSPVATRFHGYGSSSDHNSGTATYPLTE